MRRSCLILPLVVLVGAAVPVTLEAAVGSSATVGSSGATISVLAGVPRELAFKVSPSFITSPSVVVRVTNRGKLRHSFKFCTESSSYPNVNSCTGVSTKLLAPGATATVDVTFPRSGNYEYLSGTVSQAAAGMKGFVIVRLQDVSSGSSVSGAGTAVPRPGSGSLASTTGLGVDGQATDPACPAGTLIAFTGTPAEGVTGSDQDDDNEGGFASDDDGCI